MLRRILSLIACSLILSVSVAIAQEITGTIVGTVRDTTGASIPGATVTITDTDKSVVVRTLTTTEDGTFSAPQLPVGNYEVSVEAASFKRYVESKIKLDVNQRRTVDATMQAGNIEEIVTVEAEPLQVDLQSPTVGNLISGAQVRELSLNNRNFVQLTTLMPGVSSNLDDQVYVGTSNPDGQANIVAISVNGSRSSSNSWAVDGADTTDRGSNLTIQTYPSVDAIGEVKILRSLYPAETGRSGGGQVNVVTRSGTREFHGTLYEFFRNDRLNAGTFFNNQRAPLGLDKNGKAKRPPLRYNNFGYTIGGPVFIPKLYNEERNKTFFFFSQEFRRVISYPVFRAQVPNSDLRRGIFPSPVCVATTTSANGTITCTRTATQITNINPVAQAYINEIYAPLGEPDSAGFLTSAQRNIFNFRQEILKIDHTFSEKLSAFYRLQNDKIPTLDANALFSSGSQLPGVSTTETDSPGRTHVARFTYSINSSTVLDGGYSYSYGAILSEVIGKINQQNSPSIRVPLPFENTRGRIPTITGNGFAAVQGFGPYDNFSNNKALHLNLSKIAGIHSMKFGGLFSVYRKQENAIPGSAGTNEGTFSLFPSYTTGVRPAGTSAALQQWANFLLGNAGQFQQAKLDTTADLRAKNIELYAQDEWRVRSNLTLYLGLRYSRFGQPYDNLNQLTNFDPTAFDPAKAFVVNGSGNRVGNGDPLNGIIVNAQNAPANPSPYDKQINNDVEDNFAPRVGLSWDPFKNGRLAVRTGYGIYHDQALLGIYQQNVGTNPPFQDSVTITNPRLDNPTSGVVSVSSAAPSLRGVALPYDTPYVQHWSLDIQHQLAAKTLLSAGYYGSKGTHLLGVLDLNLLPPGLALRSQCRNASGALVQCQTPGQQFTTAAQETILDQIRPYRGYRAVNVVQTRFNSNYHSMQLSLQQRLTGTSQINVAYTWSKNLTDNQTDRSTAPQNPYDIRSEYGRAQLDRRHIFTLNYIYHLPFYRTESGFTEKLLGGWQLSGIITYNTGLPLTVTTSGQDPAGIGFLGPSVASPRPDIIGNPNSGPRTVDKWFNTDAFANVPTGENRVGNSGRGIVDGPPLTRFDLTLMKNIRVSETTRFQLRGEVFNIFNHTNFKGVDTSLTSSTFGRVTSTRDPRIIQLSIKFYF